MGPHAAPNPGAPALSHDGAARGPKPRRARALSRWGRTRPQTPARPRSLTMGPRAAPNPGAPALSHDGAARGPKPRRARAPTNPDTFRAVDRASLRSAI